MEIVCLVVFQPNLSKQIYFIELLHCPTCNAFHISISTPTQMHLIMTGQCRVTCSVVPLEQFLGFSTLLKGTFSSHLTIYNFLCLLNKLPYDIFWIRVKRLYKVSCILSLRSLKYHLHIDIKNKDRAVHYTNVTFEIYTLSF